MHLIPVAGQIVEKQAAARKLAEIVEASFDKQGLSEEERCERLASVNTTTPPGGDVQDHSRQAEIVGRQSTTTQPISTQDETAEQFIETLRACVKTIIYDARSQTDGDSLFSRTQARIQALLNACASSRLSAAQKKYDDLLHQRYENMDDFRFRGKTFAELTEIEYQLSAAQAKLARYEALDQHLPPGFAIGDDATADLAIKLVETEAKLVASQKENLELLRQLGIQIKAWEGQSDLREEAEKKLAAAEKELERLREVLRGNQTVWGKDLAELIDFAAERREAQAKRENSIECVAPKLREAASNIRAALGEAQKP